MSPSIVFKGSKIHAFSVHIGVCRSNSSNDNQRPHLGTMLVVNYNSQCNVIYLFFVLGVLPAYHSILYNSYFLYRFFVPLTSKKSEHVVAGRCSW